MQFNLQINEEYFNWLKNTVTKQVYSANFSYDKLLYFLYCYDFIPTEDIPKDNNRAIDGLDLRYRFGDEYGYSYDTINDNINTPCSMLEMMIGLSVRIEETIMDNPQYGNRTPQWFWGMVASLGLGKQDDKNFDPRYCDDILQRFMNRNYSANGSGGLFTIDNPDCDMRTIEIWWQAARYLNEFN